MKEKEFNTLQAYVTILGGDLEILQEKTQDKTVKNHPLVVQFSVELVQKVTLWSLSQTSGRLLRTTSKHKDSWRMRASIPLPLAC